MVVVHQPHTKPHAVASQPSEIWVCPWELAIDTREQAPWPMQGLTVGGKLVVLKRRVCTLHTGDYSIIGHESRVVLERKSPPDMLSSITSGNARFKREHERAAEIVAAGGYAAVIVEGCLAAICDELDSPNSERRMTSETVMGVVAAWAPRYGVHWMFAGDRRRAELLAFRILYKWWEANRQE